MVRRSVCADIWASCVVKTEVPRWSIHIASVAGGPTVITGRHYKFPRGKLAKGIRPVPPFRLVSYPLLPRFFLAPFLLLYFAFSDRPSFFLYIISRLGHYCQDLLTTNTSLPADVHSFHTFIEPLTWPSRGTIAIPFLGICFILIPFRISLNPLTHHSFLTYIGKNKKIWKKK